MDFEVVEEKSRCGGCILCCTVTGVPELNKQPYIMCHCSVAGKGCNCYSKRPGSCQRFECAWYSDKDWTHDLRPDRCHAVFEKVKHSKLGTYICLMEIDHQHVFKMPLVQQKIYELNRKGFAVVASSGRGTAQHAFFPDGMNPQAMWDDLKEAALALKVI